MAQVKYIKDLYENEETSLREISQAEYLIKREGLQEEMENSKAFSVVPAQNTYPPELVYCKQLEFCLERRYQNPGWSGFLPYNQRYHPELLESVPYTWIVPDCCGKPCKIPTAQCNHPSEMVLCPLCERLSTFCSLDTKNRTAAAFPEVESHSETVRVLSD